MLLEPEWLEWCKDSGIHERILGYMCDQTFEREFMIKRVSDDKVVRCNPVRNTNNLMFWMKYLKMFLNKYTFYHSLSTYRMMSIPMTGCNLRERMHNPKYKDFIINGWKKMSGYDFLIDIDGEHDSFRFCIESAKIVREFLNMCRCPYYLRFSGSGFHFIIPYSYFSFLGMSFNPDDRNNIYTMYEDIVEYVFDNFTELVDKGLHDSRRVVKLPYTPAVYDDGTYMCLPVDDLDAFELEKFKLSGISFDDMPDDTIHHREGNIKKLLYYVYEDEKKNSGR